MIIIIAILLLTIILLILAFSQTDKQKSLSANMVKPIEIIDNLDWIDIEKFINQIVAKKLSLTSGKDTIIKFIASYYPEFKTDFLQKLDFYEIQNEFIDWITEALSESLPPKNIVALYFGLFASSDPQLAAPDENLMVLYVTGSTISPEQSPIDWAVDSEYLPPKRYYVLSTNSIINQELTKYHNTSGLEQILFNGITNLILINSMDILSSKIKNNSYYIGSGFDSGPCFIIGKTKS